jgi:hypothetical protein
MAMNSRFYWLIVVLMLGSTMMGACAAPPAPTPTLAPTATPAPKPTATAPAGIPAGIYKPDPPGVSAYMLFTAQGRYISSLPGGPRTGSYVVTGDQIVFNADDGPCVNVPGTYHWELNGNTLIFKAIQDDCTQALRQEDMTGRSWILQP